MPDTPDLSPAAAEARTADTQARTPNKRLTAEERRARDIRATNMRAAGYEYRDIARALGFADQSGAYKAVNRVRKAAVREAGSELLTLEIERLDMLQRAASSRAVAGDAASIRVTLRVMEQRAKLLGLYEARGEERIADARDAFRVFLGQVEEKYPDPDPMPDDENEDEEETA